MKRIQLLRSAGVAATATAALLLAGCGNPSDSPSPDNTADSTAAMPGMSAMPAAPAGASDDTPVATDTIKIENFAFSPTVATVKVGPTVTWMNNGPIKSPTMQQGDTFTYTFTTPGRFEYLCTIHPFMTATLVVTP